MALLRARSLEQLFDISHAPLLITQLHLHLLQLSLAFAIRLGHLRAHIVIIFHLLRSEAAGTVNSLHGNFWLILHPLLICDVLALILRR